MSIILDYETDNGHRGLGDIIISTSIIKAFFKEYHTRIDVVLRKEAQPLLKNNPYVRRIYEKYPGDCDLWLIMGWKLEDYYVERNQQNRLDAMAQLFGVFVADKQPRLYYPPIEKIPNSIGIAIESMSPSRSWRNDYMLDLIKRFPELEWHVFGKIEANLPTTVHNHLGKSSLKELIQQVHSMERFVTMDTLFSHLTAAFEIPTIAMYTTVPSEWRCKYYPKTIGIQAAVSCSPCWDGQKKELHAELAECDQRRGKELSIKCVDSFTPDIIEKAIKENLL